MPRTYDPDSLENVEVFLYTNYKIDELSPRETTINVEGRPITIKSNKILLLPKQIPLKQLRAMAERKFLGYENLNDLYVTKIKLKSLLNKIALYHYYNVFDSDYSKLKKYLGKKNDKDYGICTIQNLSFNITNIPTYIGDMDELASIVRFSGIGFNTVTEYNVTRGKNEKPHMYLPSISVITNKVIDIVSCKKVI